MLNIRPHGEHSPQAHDVERLCDASVPVFGIDIEPAAAAGRLHQLEFAPRHGNPHAVVMLAGDGRNRLGAVVNDMAERRAGRQKDLVQLRAHALHEVRPHIDAVALDDGQPLLCKQVFGIGLGVVEYGHGASERIW